MGDRASLCPFPPPRLISNFALGAAPQGCWASLQPFFLSLSCSLPAQREVLPERDLTSLKEALLHNPHSSQVGTWLVNRVRVLLAEFW